MAATLPSPRRQRHQLRLDSAGAVWLLTATIALSAVAVTVLAVAPLERASAPIEAPWGLLAALFLIGEIAVVHVRLGRESHTFGMGEIPLVVGLFLDRPLTMVTAQLVGRTLACGWIRRQPLRKLVFNLAQFSLGSALAVVAFHAILDNGNPMGPSGVVATLAATAVTTLVSTSAVVAAVTIVDGVGDPARWFGPLALDAGGALVNASLALLGVVILWYHPAAALLLVPPLIGLQCAYRAYTQGARRDAQVRVLYETGESLGSSAEIEEMISALLSHARRMFKADLVELTLAPTSEGDPTLRALLDERGMTPLLPITPEPAEASLMSSPGAGRARLLTLTAGAGAEAVLSARGLHEAVIASLVGDQGPRGTLLVGNRPGRVTPFRADDIRLVATLATHVGIALESGSLERNLERLETLREQLHHQAFHDSLTDLPNRALFGERLREALDRRSLDGASLAVLFVDLDDFKVVNDSLGHAAGDALLRAVGARLVACLPAGATVARLGGDEFGILLDTVSGVGMAGEIADRAVALLDQPLLLPQGEVLVGGSIGVAIAVAGEPDADSLLRNADVAMYRAKAEGKGRHEVYVPEMHARVVERHELRTDIGHAVDRDELSVVYQPIIALASGRMEGVEALVRWRHPRRHQVAPEDFIPLAEENGSIVPIGLWMLRSVCAQGVAWRRRHPGRELDLTVNLSVRQLQHPESVEAIASTVLQSGLDPGRLVLEITEGFMITDVASVRAQLQRLRMLGLRLAMDDFGTGYSSLMWLRDLPVDMLKIARPLVEHLGEGPDSDALAEAVIRLGQTLRLGLVAEGVETSSQRDRLHQLGCPHAQGYFFARPTGAEAITELIAADVLPARWRPGGISVARLDEAARIG